MSVVVDSEAVRFLLADKEASRRKDRETLRSGVASPEEIARKNDFFRDLPIKEFEIVAVRGRSTSA